MTDSMASMYTIEYQIENIISKQKSVLLVTLGAGACGAWHITNLESAPNNQNKSRHACFKALTEEGYRKSFPSLSFTRPSNFVQFSDVIYVQFSKQSKWLVTDRKAWKILS